MTFPWTPRVIHGTGSDQLWRRLKTKHFLHVCLFPEVLEIDMTNIHPPITNIADLKLHRHDDSAMIRNIKTQIWVISVISSSECAPEWE